MVAFMHVICIKDVYAKLKFRNTFPYYTSYPWRTSPQNMNYCWMFWNSKAHFTTIYMIFNILMLFKNAIPIDLTINGGEPLVLLSSL